MSALTKADIVEQLSRDTDLSKESAKGILDTYFEEISAALESGEHVKLSGFGSYNLKHKKERLGRNIRTGESVHVPARRVVAFRTSEYLQQRIDDAYEGDAPQGE